MEGSGHAPEVPSHLTLDCNVAQAAGTPRRYSELNNWCAEVQMHGPACAVDYIRKKHYYGET